MPGLRSSLALAIALLALAPVPSPAQEAGAGEAEAQKPEAQKPESPKLSEAEKRELAALGILEEPAFDLEEMAADHLERQQAEENRPAARIARYAAAAAETIEDKEPEKGVELLNRLDLSRLNAAELAQVYQVRAYLAYEIGDTDAAVVNFRKVLEQQIMEPADESRMRFNIAQLEAAQQNWSGTIRALHDWSKYVTEKPPVAYYLMAVAQYQIENIDAAVRWAEKAVEVAQEPKEPWLQLLAALYVEKEDFKSARPVLEDLVVHFPKKAYWTQLALIYGALENYRRSLAVQQVAYAQGLLTEDDELRRLARSLLYANLPYQAAQVLEKGLEQGAIEPEPEAYELLANSYIAAREYDASLPPLQKAAALSDTGDLYVRLGQVHMQREEWDQAAEMFREALDKGDLKDSGQALLLLGISYFNGEQVGQARSYFARAAQHDESRAEAERWIKHIDQAETEADAAAANPT